MVNIYRQTSCLHKSGISRMSVRDWFAAGLQLVTNQLSAMKLDQLKRFRRLLYSWFKFTRTRQVKVSYQATSIQKPVLDCLCPLRDCLLFTKDRLILVSIILAAAKTCGFSAGLVTGRSLQSMMSFGKRRMDGWIGCKVFYILAPNFQREKKLKCDKSDTVTPMTA